MGISDRADDRAAGCIEGLAETAYFAEIRRGQDGEEALGAAGKAIPDEAIGASEWRPKRKASAHVGALAWKPAALWSKGVNGNCEAAVYWIFIQSLQLAMLM